MTLLYKEPSGSYAHPTVLSCKQCDFARVLDNYHQAKDRAALHLKLSHHDDFELTPYDPSPSASTLWWPTSDAKPMGRDAIVPPRLVSAPPVQRPLHLGGCRTRPRTWSWSSSLMLISDSCSMIDWNRAGMRSLKRTQGKPALP